MKVELKKINVSKSVIDQIQFANSTDILKHSGAILGFCLWIIGTGKNRRAKKLILFFNEAGEIRKLSEYDKMQFDNQLNTITLLRSGMSDHTYTFKEGKHRQEFSNALIQLQMIANEQGQFFY